MYSVVLFKGYGMDCTVPGLLRGNRKIVDNVIV